MNDDNTSPKSKIEQIEEKLSQPNPSDPKPDHKSTANTTSILGEAQSADDLMRIMGIIK